jgi:flagellar protein FliS
MAAQPYAAKLAAYQSTSAHSNVAVSDPHRLIVLLLDGALERITMAKGCIQRGAIVDKAQLINRTVNIVGELRGSLDLKAGGEIARNLSELYDYICTRLLKASIENHIGHLDEVSGLLREIRGAWIAIPTEARAR